MVLEIMDGPAPAISPAHTPRRPLVKTLRPGFPSISTLPRESAVRRDSHRSSSVARMAFRAVTATTAIAAPTATVSPGELLQHPIRRKLAREQSLNAFL